MAYSGNFEYRGIEFHFEGETKQHMVDALAGIDYLLTRKGATDDAPAAEASASEEKPARKPAKKAKAATAKDDGPNMTAEQAAQKEAAEKEAAEKEAAEKEAAEKEAAEKEAAEKEAAEKEAQAEQKEEGPAQPSLDDLRSAVMAYAKANGNVKGKALVEKYGAAKISDVPEDQWADLLAEAQAGV